MRILFIFTKGSDAYNSTLSIEWWNRPVIIPVADKIEAIQKARMFYREQVDKVNRMEKSLKEFEKE